MSIAQVRSAGSAGNYYTDKDNYYVLGSMGERWAGQGAEQLGLQGSVDKDVFTRLLEGRLPDGADCRCASTSAVTGSPFPAPG
ncbi:relaxase domain-containing protein [Escherichia coli]|uniref:relaxase domain-containing protein n=1 Tax=Escherichia coli TaxID=562 RepID=UPI003D801501